MPQSQSKKTTLYALGSNGSGQLGLSHKDDTATPEKCRFKSLGLDGKPKYTNHVPLQKEEKVKKLVGGGNHTLLLTTHGRVFGTGSWIATHIGAWNDEKKPGFIEVDRKQFAEAGSGVMDVGYFFRKPGIYTAELTVSQRQPSNEECPCVTDIAAAWESSYFVVDAQRVYCCGAGDKGELGRGDVREFLQREPKYWLIFDLRHVEGEDDNAKIIRISACMSHVVVLTSSGNLYGWGTSRKGELGGNWQKDKIVWEPFRVSADGISSHIKHVVTGRNFTFVMGEFGNDYALLGAAPKGGFDFPIDFRDIIPDRTGDDELARTASDLLEFHALWGSVIVRLPHGDFQGYGRDDRGQLGDEVYPGGIRQLAAGSEHCVGLAGNGTVYAWGWGEHGNCGEVGLVDSQNRDEDHLGTSIFAPEQTQRVVGVGAGCATSFFWVEG